MYMREEKILTVSIAAYNMEQYLEETLVSLVNPDCIHMLDVIIVNDGSTDKTREIAMRYTEQYPDSFRLIDKENGGYGSTINCALKHARSKYIKLLDGDDWFETENLPVFLEYLQKTNEDLVLTSYRYYDCDKNHPNGMESLPYEPYASLGIEKLTKYSMYALAVRTELVKDSVTITENCYYTDVEWYLKAAICCKSFVALPVDIYCYRLGREGQSVSVEGYIKHIAEHEYITKLAVDLYIENEKLSGLEKVIAGILQRTYQYLLLSRRTISNIKKLFEYRHFIKNKGKFATPYLDGLPRIIHKCPCFILLPRPILKGLYGIYHKIKVKKRG